MADKYLKRYRDGIKMSKSDEEINTVLDRLYNDGFEDGMNEGK